MKTQLSKSMGCSKSSSKREVYSNTGLPQKTRKISNKNLTYHLKEFEKNRNPNHQKERNNNDQRGNK